MKKLTFEDRINELEEDTKVLKERIDIQGSALYDIVHDDEDFENLRKRVNHLEYDMKQHKHDKDGYPCMYYKSEKGDQDSDGNKTYTVIFNNGQTINITADKVEWLKGEGIVCFLYMDVCVAQFIINSIAGLVDASYLAFTQAIYKAI